MQQIRFASHLDVGQSLQQFTEHHRDLTTGEMGA